MSICPYKMSLGYSYNKYRNLIGHSEVSISHRDLQVFIETYKFSAGGNLGNGYWRL